MIPNEARRGLSPGSLTLWGRNMETANDNRMALLCVHLDQAARWADRALWGASMNKEFCSEQMFNSMQKAAEILGLHMVSRAPVETAPVPSDRPCAEVNPVLWAYFSRVTGRNGDPSAVWSEADVVQCLDGKLSDRP